MARLSDSTTYGNHSITGDADVGGDLDVQGSVNGNGSTINGQLVISNPNIQLELVDSTYSNNYWQIDHQSGDLFFRYNGTGSALTLTEEGIINGDGSGITNVNAQKLDNINSTQFIRSDVSGQTVTTGSGSISFQSNSSTLDRSSMGSGNNLHIDPPNDGVTYLNFYAGTGGVIFGNGAGAGNGASVSSAGVFSGDGSGLTDVDANQLDGIDSTGFMRTNVNNNITANITSSGSSFVVGNGGGSVGMTTNDGQGNANITFNHAQGVADSAGNVGRIVVNTDSTVGATMSFELASNDTAGAVQSINQMTLTEGSLDVKGLSINGINSNAFTNADEAQVDAIGTNAERDILIQTSEPTSGQGNDGDVCYVYTP